MPESARKVKDSEQEIKTNTFSVSSVSAGQGEAIHLESDRVCGSLDTQTVVSWAGESREAPGAWMWGGSAPGFHLLRPFS